MFVRVLDVIEERCLVRVTASEFGFEHLNDKRRQKYVGALERVLALVRASGESPHQSSDPKLTLATVRPTAEALSEVKGMFSQCQRKDQPAWFRVWRALGEPSRDDARRCADRLGELRKRIEAEGGPNVTVDAVMDSVGKGFERTLAAALETIRDEGVAISDARLIGHRRFDGRRSTDVHRPHSSPAMTRRKVKWATETHEELLQELRRFLEQRQLELVENRYVDAHCRLPDGQSLLFEVKSLSDDNELEQMRSGVAQLYEYRYREDLEDASLWLVFSRRPTKEVWIEHYLEQDRDIRVLWIVDGELGGSSFDRLPERREPRD